MNEDEAYSFGNWVRYRRMALGLTQAALAHQVGCATITIRKIEGDERRPSRTMAERLAERLGISEAERQTFILGGLGEVPVYVMPLSSELVQRELERKVFINQSDKELCNNEKIESLSAMTSIPTHNLPPQLTPFIGREEELAELNALINNPGVRLVTIVGPGGIGKTRLALAYAERLVEGDQKFINLDTHFPKLFSDGVFFVDLTLLSEVNHIILAITNAVNIQVIGGVGSEKSPRQQLLTYLTDKRMLFIMDNFEQLLAGVDLISDILQAGSEIQFLVTSRERLQLRQEQLYPIPALDYRDWETPEKAAEFTAVKIFLQAAHRIRPDFDLTMDDLTDLENICYLVDGMPLALELAAGWVELLPLAEIAAEIKSSLGFLTTELQDIPERHRSMWAVFDATWERLGSTERALVQKLSVFRRGFTREAATKVMSNQDELEISLQLLIRLVNKSLLKVNPDQDRYQIHELLRQYAHERLVASTRLDATRTAHSQYYTEFVNQREAELKGSRQKDAIAEIEADFANIRAAWEWALSQGNQMAIDRSLNGLSLFSLMRGRHLEAMDLILKAEAQFASNTDREKNKIWRKIAMSRIYLDHDVWFFDLTEKLDEAERILTAAQLDGDQIEVAFVLLNLGWLQLNHDLDAGLKHLVRSLDIYHQLSDYYFATTVMYLNTFVYLSRGRFGEGVNNAVQTLKIARKSGNQLSIAFALDDIGFVTEISGRYSEAEYSYQEARTIFFETDDLHWGSENIAHIGWLAFLKGDVDRARELITEGLMQARKFNLALPIHKAQGMQGMLCNLEEQYDQAAELCQDLAQFVSFWAFGGLLGMTYASCGLGDHAAAWQYLCKAMEIAISIRALSWQTQCLPAGAILAASDGQNVRATEMLALAYQHPASATGWLKKLPLVIRLRTSLEEELSPQVFAAAWERGLTLDLEETVTSIKTNPRPI